jgi:hypothetical protein
MLTKASLPGLTRQSIRQENFVKSDDARITSGHEDNRNLKAD